MRHKSKLLSIFIISVLAFATLFYVVSNFLNSKVNAAVYKLADKLTAKLGQTVKISSVNTKWQGVSLKIDVKGLAVFDDTTQTPILMVDRIVSTVDVLKSLLSLSVKYRHLLLQSPRFAVQWDGINPPLVLGLAENQRSGQLNITQVLQLLAQQRNITVQNGDFHIQGLNEADIPLMNVTIDLKEKKSLDFTMILRGSVAAANPPEFNAAVHFTGTASDISKYMLEFDVKTSNLQVDELLNLIPKYKQNFIRGSFSDLDFKGAIQNGILRYVKTEFSIDKLQAGSYLSIGGGNGEVLFKPTADHLQFAASNFTLKEFDNPSYAVYVKSLSADIRTSTTDGALTLDSDNLNINLMNMGAKSKITVTVKDDEIASYSLNTKFDNASVPKVTGILPVQLLGKTVTNWLQQCLVAGEVLGLELSKADKKTHFKTELRNTELQYSRQWPSIHSIDADVVFNDSKLEVVTHQASIINSKIENLTTEFKEQNKRPFMLVLVRGNVTSTLEQGLSFLQQSPLKSKLASGLQIYNPSGMMKLELGMDIDLTAKESAIALQGTLDLAGASMQLPDTKIMITNIEGKVGFTNDSLIAKDLSLKFAGHPGYAELQLQSGKDRDLHAKLTSQIDVATLQQTLPDMNLAGISGTTNFVAQINMPWGKSNEGDVITVSSNLQGIGFEYPPPLNKQAESKLALLLKYTRKKNSERLVNINLGGWLDAELFLKQGKVQSGTIALNSGRAVRTQKSQLLLTGKLADLNWDLWESWLQQHKGGAIAAFDLNIFLHNLQYHGETYKDLALKYDSVNHLYRLDSPIVKGEINISPELDKIAIQLERLNLGDKKMSDSSIVKNLQDKHQQKNLPIIQFYSESLSIGKQQYRKVSVQLIPRTYGYEITDLAISNDNILLQAQGQWSMDSPASTQLSGNAYTKNLGVIVKDLNFGKSIGKGNGELNFSLQWPGDPTQFSLAKSDGTSHVELQNGIIAGVNPGLGRIIGLLSLESIQRRLKLDFSDLDSNGLAFDSLTSDLNLNSGIVSSKKILINSPSARIELKGNSNLDTRELDFEMFVTPKVGVGLPVAAAIAVGNPIAGAAVWLFDQATGSKISEITKYKYQITGTWETPKIVEVTSQHDPKNSDPPTQK